MVKFSKSAQKTLVKLSEGRVLGLDYNEISNVVTINECCDWHFEVDLNKKDCLNLAEVFLKLAKTIDKNSPKAGKTKVVEVEKEVEVKIEDKLQGVWVANLLGYINGGIVKGGTVGTYVTKDELIDSLTHNGYIQDEDKGEYSYIKTLDDGQIYTASIEYLEVNRKK